MPRTSPTMGWRSPPAQLAAEHLLELACPIDEPFGFEDLQVGAAGRARQGVAGVRQARPEDVVVEIPRDPLRNEHAAERHVARRHALGEGHHVRQHVPVLAGESGAGPTESGHALVEDGSRAGRSSPARRADSRPVTRLIPPPIIASISTAATVSGPSYMSTVSRCSRSPKALRTLTRSTRNRFPSWIRSEGENSRRPPELAGSGRRPPEDGAPQCSHSAVNARSLISGCQDPDRPQNKCYRNGGRCLKTGVTERTGKEARDRPSATGVCRGAPPAVRARRPT